MVDVPPVYRKRRGRVKRKPPAPPAPAGPLVLVAAAYEETAYVDLTFDRAVSVAEAVAGAFAVRDGTVGWRYVGFGAPSLVSANVVRVELTGDEEIVQAGVTLSVAPGNGIVAAGDGAAWAGATDLELPFP